MGPRPELFHPTYWYHRTYQIKVTCISPYGMDLVFMHHHLKTFNTFYCIGLSCCAKAAKLNSFFFFLSFLGWWIYLLVRIIIIIIIYRQGVGCVQSKFGVLNTMPRLGDLSQKDSCVGLCCSEHRRPFSISYKSPSQCITYKLLEFTLSKKIIENEWASIKKKKRMGLIKPNPPVVQTMNLHLSFSLQNMIKVFCVYHFRFFLRYPFFVFLFSQLISTPLFINKEVTNLLLSNIIKCWIYQKSFCENRLGVIQRVINIMDTFLTKL